MAATDVEQRLIEGLVAIVSADAGIRTLCGGRTKQILVPFEDASLLDRDLPVIAYEVTLEQIGGVGDNRRAGVRFSIVALGAGAAATCRAIAERLELGLTQPLFAAQGLDAAVVPGSWRRVPAPFDRQGTDQFWRTTLECQVWITK